MEQNKTEENGETLESAESLDPAVPVNNDPTSVVSNETGAVGGDSNDPEKAETLEGQSTTEKLPDNTTLATSEQVPVKKKPHIKRGIEKLAGLNIYLLGFILVLVVAGIIGFVAYSRNKKEEAKKDQLITEPLSQEVLDQLKQTDVRVGDPKQILSIESNAVFAGKVLIRDSLEVAGQLKIGGPLELPGIKVSGSSSLDQLQAKTADISGNTNVQGQLSVGGGATVGGNLSVSGTLTAGQLNIANLQVGGNLTLIGHIDAGGGTPGASRGGAVGGGGTVSVSGTDTAGTVNINTGSGASAGCYATISFTKPFNSTPHVVISPISGAAANARYYVSRTSNNFSICSASAASSGAYLGYDYFVID